jgi:Archaeal PaREP1/PaREP8 family
MTTDAVLAIQNHAIHSQQYFENAVSLLEQGEAAKAGELFWGSLAQAFRALAVYKGQEVKTHRDLKNLAIQLSRDLQDESVAIDFELAENLHFNFYVVQREIEDIVLVLPAIERLRRRVFSLIPPELIERRTSI